MKAQPRVVNFVNPVNQRFNKTNFVGESGRTKIIGEKTCGKPTSQDEKETIKLPAFGIP